MQINPTASLLGITTQHHIGASEKCLGVTPDSTGRISFLRWALGSFPLLLLLMMMMMLGEGDAVVPTSAHRSRSTESRYSYEILGGRRLRQG